MTDIPVPTTGQRIRLHREARGMSRPVLAGLVGRSPDWLKKIERGERQLNSLTLLLRLAAALGVTDLSVLTGEAPTPVSAWGKATHPAVPGIRRAMHDVSFDEAPGKALSAGELRRQVAQAWSLWHSSPRQRTDVGRLLPALIIAAHACVRHSDGIERRCARAATGDLYRLVQRLLAHICEPELHALAVERGRAMSEDADTPIALASAAWSSAVSYCAAGQYDFAIQLAETGAGILRSRLDDSPDAGGVLGALQLEAAAAHALAGRAGDAYRYLDARRRRQTSCQLDIGTANRHSNGEMSAYCPLSSTPTCIERERQSSPLRRSTSAPCHR
ncbi:helix-turn-helix transcriptional regulator [Nocardia sp. NPDC050193]